MQGSYTYVPLLNNEEGEQDRQIDPFVRYVVNWIADTNGYREERVTEIPALARQFQSDELY